MSLVNKEQNSGKMEGITNNKGAFVEKYIPRKCSATSKILHVHDKSSVQITVPKLDASGKVIAGTESSIIAISGYIRNKGRSDWEIEKILTAQGIYPIQE